MNGVIYECEGCGRTGAVPERRGWYECPVCRWLGEIPGERDKWVVYFFVQRLPWLLKWKWAAADNRQRQIEGSKILKPERAYERGDRTRPEGWITDPREKWKRWHRANRMLRKRVQSG